ncbi:MAG: EamA family transporter [Patescibacteria group bacterium]|jgi:transporter family protein
MSWIFYAILSAVFAALVAIFGKIGISKVDTTLATSVRAVVMAVFLVLVSLVLGKSQLLSSINSKALFYIVLSGIAGALSWIFYFIALKNGPASGVAALDRLSVVFVLILAILILGEHLTWKSATGIGLMVAGAILMVLK